MTFPTLDLERELLQSHTSLISLDEVGRGALAGPVAVGAFFFTEQQAEIPEGLKDSKLIPEQKRPEISERVIDWGQSAVGMASAEEIEAVGITASLALAAGRAISQLPGAQLILLDGSHNWLGSDHGKVMVRTKADRDCASVAAASVVAKVQRDKLMTELALEISQYGFERNKGYSSPGHIAALREHGPSSQHRTSWLGKILGGSQTLF